MIDKSDFNNIRKRIEEDDSKRESVIRKSRDLVKLSKQIIYAVHRDELKGAENLIKEIRRGFDELNKIAKKNQELLYSGSFKVAVQEYVEAVCFFNLVKNKRLTGSKEFGDNVEYYLLGVCDLTGELVRKATNYAIQGNHRPALFIKDFVEELYNQFMLMDLRNSELRKKFDGMRYDLKKLEDLALAIKFKK